MKIDRSVLEEKSPFKVLGLSFFSKFDWGSYITSITKTASIKIGVFIRSMKFLSPEVALYLYHMALHGNTVVMFGLVLLTANWKF